MGWRDGAFEERSAPAVWLDGQQVPYLQQFGFLRHDVAAGMSGFVWEYLLPEERTGELTILEIEFGWAGDKRTRFQETLSFESPDHRKLFTTNEVQHREQIYAAGPPNTEIHPEIWEMAKTLKGPVLDFGCGRGLMVAALRAVGIEAHGLELDTPAIRQCAPADVTLYDGTFPSPLEAGRFASVICSEVLEHIPNYEAAVSEIARLAGETVLITAPDASAIPLGFLHQAVPWHLLESTHVNFFNQQSLRRVLERHFSKIQFGRVGGARFNGTPYYVSLMALCLK